MKNKRILITGAAGTIGEELVRQLAPFNTLYCIDINETGVFDLIEELKLRKFNVEGRVGDVRDLAMLDRAFSHFNPEAVFICSALKHVTPNEWHPMEAVKTNVEGVWNILQCAKKYKVKKLVNISTDKVVNANSIMGSTKKVGELMVKNAGYINVRFGNVMGSRGSVMEIWQRQMNSGEPLTVTDPKMERYFMTIPQAVNLVIKAGTVGKPREIIILDMGKLVNVLQAAKEVLGKVGKSEYPIKIIGVREGETLSERLMTPDEELRAVKKDKFWIIR